ncbi:hypothetical protein [Nocardioides zeicaulis]|uniref:Type IV toxin-antitoxin system AbiEi family antitoxin domain-containing protein n=1 Tax=Nocardioides zeicaulis TaxID=1776857 RepID=A0ABV6E6I8_9ACTN
MQSPPPDLRLAVRLRRELLADGYTDDQLTRLLRAGVLVRIRRGAYVEKKLWDRLAPEDRHRVLSRAVLRAGHPLMALTHVSAVLELGVAVWGVPLDEVHTTRTDGKGARREAGVVHHSGLLAESETQVVEGVRIGPAARAAVEVMATATPEAALVVANGLLHARHITRPELVAAAQAMKHWPYSLSAHVVVALADGRFESVGETRAFYLCRQQGLPRPEPQYVVRDERGNVVARLDLAWPAYGVFVEFDGRAKYDQHRRPGETLAQYLLREKKREELVCLLTGWVCIRITWEDLARPLQTGSRIRRVLELRRPLGA